MASEFHWSCPFCDHDTTVTAERCQDSTTDLTIKNADGPRRLRSLFIVCPNPDCRKTSLTVTLRVRDTDSSGYPRDGDLLQQWHLIPSSRALAFPDYVPEAIRSDYAEACLIQDLSPKASATLSRRCLQGIIRDYWSAKPGRLVDEIKQIEDKVDPLVWDAIDSVRQVGNIGAHMEKDIDLIVDVEPNEADLLVGLIELLIRETYVAREVRRERLARIKSVADHKAETRKGNSSSS